MENNLSAVGMSNISDSNALIPVKKLATSFLMYKIGKYNILLSKKFIVQCNSVLAIYRSLILKPLWHEPNEYLCTN